MKLKKLEELILLGIKSVIYETNHGKKISKISDICNYADPEIKTLYDFEIIYGVKVISLEF